MLCPRCKMIVPRGCGEWHYKGWDYNSVKKTMVQDLGSSNQEDSFFSIAVTFYLPV